MCIYRILTDVNLLPLKWKIKLSVEYHISLGQIVDKWTEIHLIIMIIINPFDNCVRQLIDAGNILALTDKYSFILMNLFFLPQAPVWQQGAP